MSVSLNLRKCKNDGDIHVVSIKHGHNNIENIKFDSDQEAIDKYSELTTEKKKRVIADPIIPDPSHNEAGTTDEEIKEYVLGNLKVKGVKSARHLNAKFKLKLKQVYYTELLKGL